MIRTRPRQSLLSALFALVVGLFVLAPFADAMACGPEQAETAASVLITADADHAEADDCCTPGHGCAHGHCHAPATLPPLGVEAPHVWASDARLGAPPGRLLLSTASGGLIRPPRA